MSKKIIYKLVNTRSNKVYVGQTKNTLNRRKSEHLHRLRHNIHQNKELQESFNQDGESNFEFIILKECDSSNADYWESYYISYYNSDNKKYGFNKASGGIVGFTVNNDTRKKMSESRPDVSGKNNPMYGVKRSKEVREKISKTRIKEGIGKGEKNPFYGKKHTLESRRKISENNRGKNAWNKGKAYYQIRGHNNANAKYSLWDIEKVHFHKNTFFKDKNKSGDNPRKCFLFKYEGKDVHIGGFIEFVTPTIIYDLVKEELERAI